MVPHWCSAPHVGGGGLGMNLPTHPHTCPLCRVPVAAHKLGLPTASWDISGDLGWSLGRVEFEETRELNRVQCHGILPPKQSCVPGETDFYSLEINSNSGRLPGPIWK